MKAILYKTFRRIDCESGEWRREKPREDTWEFSDFFVFLGGIIKENRKKITESDEIKLSLLSQIALLRNFLIKVFSLFYAILNNFRIFSDFYDFIYIII